MDFAQGFGQGSSIWLVALGLGAIAAAIALLRVGAERRRTTESGQPHLIAGIAALIIGLALFVPGVIWLVMGFISGA